MEKELLTKEAHTNLHPAYSYRWQFHYSTVLIKLIKPKETEMLTQLQ